MCPVQTRTKVAEGPPLSSCTGLALRFPDAAALDAAAGDVHQKEGLVSGGAAALELCPWGGPPGSVHASL